jgi:hypothetical protein
LFYETSIEQFWERLKIAAAKWAASENPIPENGECRKIIMAECRGIRLTDEVLDYYTAEFCRMVQEKRARLDG